MFDVGVDDVVAVVVVVTNCAIVDAVLDDDVVFVVADVDCCTSYDACY